MKSKLILYSGLAALSLATILGVATMSGTGTAPAQENHSEELELESELNRAIPSVPVQQVAEVRAKGEKVFPVLAQDTLRSIDRPEFVNAEKAQIADDAPVIGITDGKVARAYSLYLLDSHEIVNDQIGNRPIAITW